MRKSPSTINKEILKLAVPNIISNIAVPLLGMVDTAIAGRIGSDLNIGAFSIGTTIFNFIYWNCAFLRMGTTGITAQSYGAGKQRECANMLARSLWLSCTIACIILVLQKPIGNFSLSLMQGSNAVQVLAGEYFFARVWAVPASIIIFSIQGWFIGMQDAKTPMAITVFSVIINAVFSMIFVFHFKMGISGIAWGTVVAQYSGMLISLIFLFARYRNYIQYIDIKESFRLKPIIYFLHINKDIFMRTACVVATYTFFTAASARFGDHILTTNTLLMQLFTLFSYMSDGFAYAAESLSGRLVGEKNVAAFRKYVKYLILWALIIAIIFVIAYLTLWENILMLFSPSDEIIDYARQYIIWIIAVPMLGSIPFMLDGIMIGATQTKILRNTVFFSTVLYFITYYALAPWLQNTALWAAFIVFLGTRGVLLYFCSDRINATKIIYKEKF